jgi:hypothetical protein
VQEDYFPGIFWYYNRATYHVRSELLSFTNIDFFLEISQIYTLVYYTPL